MVELKIWTVIILIGMGMVAAIILIFFGFALGRKTQDQEILTGMDWFRPDEKPPEEDVFERALLSPEEGGYTDEELAEMKRARPYEGL